MADAPAGRKQAELAAVLLDKTYAREVIEAWRRILLNPSALPNCDCGSVAQAKINAAWQAAVNRAFNAEGALSLIRQTIADSFTATELAEMVRFRETALGRKLSELEKPPASEWDEQAFLAEVSRMRKVLAVDVRRRKMLEEITQAMGGVEAQVDVLTNISLGSALGAQTAQPEGQPRWMLDEIISMVEASRSTLRETLKPIVLYHNASIYKSLTRQELRAYRDVLVSDLGRRASRIGLDALNKAMRAQALSIGERFSREFNAQDM